MERRVVAVCEADVIAFNCVAGITTYAVCTSGDEDYLVGYPGMEKVIRMNSNEGRSKEESQFLRIQCHTPGYQALTRSWRSTSHQRITSHQVTLPLL